ncbi:M23 family metallopeptidase [Almyronema epifaneia]|uniref:M23 family metallopeptidase n=1 Tax=Almyronema epifaneia S1 TaxID=2991925 RepID=A0ABW6IHV4_9CYAN
MNRINIIKLVNAKSKYSFWIVFLFFLGTIISGLTLNLEDSNLGLNNVARAEVSGVYTGLKLPWRDSIRRTVTGAAASHDRLDRLQTVRHAIDFGLNNEDVLAIKAGTVVARFYDSSGGGNTLRIDHGDGYCSNYLHLSSFSVSQGSYVVQGQKIAVSGSSGGVAPHLHLSVTYGCTGDQSKEIQMRFSELSSRELLYQDNLISQNFTFRSGSSSPSISTNSINLTVRSSNLSGKRVYVQMWRAAANGYSAREWNSSSIASSSSLTFRDLDGSGSTFQGSDYYLVASLNPIPPGSAAKRRTSCYSATGGAQLCDRVRR